MATRLFKRFFGRIDGSVAPIFAIAAVPLIVAMGAVVDYTNAYDKKTIVQDAMDSAALAAGKKIGVLTEVQLEADVDAYYYSNVGTRLSSPPELQVAHATSSITLTTDLSVPTYFLGLIGLQSLNFHLTSEATLAFSTMEVALVLDNSGSMQTNNNIATLRTAATNLTNTLYALGAGSTKPDPIKIALVPFAGSVNVGAQFQTDAGATWLDKTGGATYHLDSVDGVATTANAFTLLAGLNLPAGAPAGYNTWGGCVEARPMPYDIDDTAATSPGTMFAPMFAPDEPDNWTCTGNGGSATCANVGSSNANRRYLGAPGGMQNYNNYLPDVRAFPATVVASTDLFTATAHGLTAGTQVVFQTSGTLPGGLALNTAYYVISSGLAANAFRVSATSGGSTVNISSAGSGTHAFSRLFNWTCQSGNAACGGAGNGASDTTAMQSIAKYGISTSKVTPTYISTMTYAQIGAGGPNFMCTTRPILALTPTQSTVTTAISNLVALGSTNIQEGVMWGWRALSPTAPFTEGRAYTVNDNQKILILMTDGDNTYFPYVPIHPLQLKSWYGAWGYISKNHLGTTATDTATVVTKMNDRTALACANAKAMGIEIFTVAFTGSTGINATTQAMLVACASHSTMAYVAADQAALVSAFQAIGEQLTLLRVSR